MPSSSRALRPGSNRLEKTGIQDPHKNMGSVAGEVGTISLEKNILSIGGRSLVIKSNAEGST